MKIKILLLVVWLFVAAVVTAQTQQDTSIPAQMTQQDMLMNMGVGEYTRIQLPPLYVLMQNARVHSPQVNIYTSRKESEERELKTIRRSWLTYIHLNAGYSYGSTDINTQQYSNNQYPVIQNVTGSDQSWWNVGASVTLPLYEIFNRRNLVKQQKKRIESIQYETDSWYDDVCLKIIEAYSLAIQYLSLIESTSAAMVTAQAQYEFSKTDFVNGRIDSQTLSRQQSIEAAAVREYEQTRAELNKALLQLEVLSKTPIVRPAEQLNIQ